MKRIMILLAGMLVIVLLTQATTVAWAAPPVNTPGNGPPTLEKVVFVHYPKEFAPGKPSGTPGKVPDKNKERDKKLYSYGKVHWPYEDAASGIDWYYNQANEPGDYLQAIKNSFNAWDSIGEANIGFIYVTTTGRMPGWNSENYDGYNVVGWADISSRYPDAIGVTIVWYYRYIKGEKIIIDCDSALNTNVEYNWTWAIIMNGDPDDIVLPGYNNDEFFDVDVQNIMTHEVGHWLMLGDLYDSAASDQTMYGHAADGELKKRSLEDGDIAGIKAIYP